MAGRGRVVSTVEGFPCVPRVYCDGIQDSEDARDEFIMHPKQYVYVKNKFRGDRGAEGFWLIPYNSFIKVQPLTVFKAPLSEIKAGSVEDRVKFEGISQGTRFMLGLYLSLDDRYNSIWYPALVFDGEYIRLVEVIM